MALIVSAASGNFNAGATWVGGVVPTVGDEARASNGHTITITANATCDEVSNAGTGIFTLNDGVTLTANVTSKSTTISRNCLQFTAASPASASIVGNITGGTVSGAVGVVHSSTGTLTITGNTIGGSATNAHGITVSSAGTLNLTGNTTGGSGAAYGLNGTGNSNVFITGNAFGGGANTAVGVIVNHTTATVTLTGNATGGTNTTATGLYNGSSGLVTVTGIATGGTLGGNQGGGINNQVTGTVIVKRAVGNAFGPGNISGLVATPGAANQSSGIIQVEELEFGQFGMSPVLGSGIRLKKVTGNYVTFPYVDSGAAKTLVDATQGQMPAASDVRFGTVYASGTLTGSCYVPAAASVAFGVPVDNTTGTAALTPASVWDHLLSAITTSDTIGTLLKTNIDATISSRSTATTAGIADAVWDEVMSGHTINETYGDRIVRSLNSNNTLQLTGSHHAAADVHEFQNEVIADYAFAPSAVTLFADAVRTELTPELDEIGEIHAIHGLKSGESLTVTPTSRSAGAISQTISGDGTTSTTVSRD